MNMKPSWMLLICSLGLFLAPILAQDDDFPDFGDAEGGTEKPSKPKLVRGPCDNRHPRDEECDEWAIGGHCTYNTWMKVHCASSCDSCDSREKGDCPNDYNDRDCELWAHAGHCSQPYSKPFMQFQCAKSCDSCDFRRREQERMKDDDDTDEKTGEAPPSDDGLGGFEEP
ncbi:uncharacterized protein LOC141906897 [Tubulanus polymorphus]|uniref:uncharacterized protein LOC141906897 n=1 Tax=Tubulanus polymorphus TaxID=672921 RepID=UPI003DA31794